MELDRAVIEEMVQRVLAEKLGANASRETELKKFAGDVIKVGLLEVKTEPKDRLETGNPNHHVYTHDVFSLEESRRLGCGIMEMKETTFDWTLNYDEIDYVIQGSLSIYANGKRVTAGPGEIILIPKGSHIQFSVDDWARFMYVTYPADWMNN